MLTIKNIFKLSILFVLLHWSNLSAQEFSKISLADFENINFNTRITLKELIAVKDYEAKLESLFGPPLSKQVQMDFMSLRNGRINYNGFHLRFTLNDEIRHLVLTKSSNILYYKGHQLKVGMSLNKIEQLFKKSYDNRYVVTISGENFNLIKVDAHPLGSGPPLILFEYEPTHRIVTEISVSFETSR